MLYVTGARFGDDFRAEDVGIENWGTLEIEFSDCDNAQISYSSTLEGWGEGGHALNRLTRLEGAACQWPQ